VAARRRSRRRAGEQEKLTRARAPRGDGDAVSILGLAEEVAEACCRRRGQARAAPVRGGSGWRQFRRRGGRGWAGSAWWVRGGGEEAIGRGNLGRVARLGRIPARRSGGGSVSWGEGKRQSNRGEGARSSFVATHGL
jgi:hypothetical protein